jgi:hypothetical protein
VKVVAGRQYIAFLSTIGDPYSRIPGTQSQVWPGTTAPGLDGFTYNPSEKDPLAMAKWGVWDPTINVVFSATFSDQAPAQPFAGTPRSPTCTGTSVTTLVQNYGGLAAAADTLGFANADALQDALSAFCKGYKFP